MSYYKDFDNYAPIKEVTELLANKQYAEAEAAARALLDKRLSMWQRVQCSTLLAGCLEDWCKAEEQRFRAESLYDNARLVYAPGDDAAIDEEMESLRKFLDDLKKKQKACQPYDFFDYDDFMVRMYLTYPRAIYTDGGWRDSLGTDDLPAESFMVTRVFSCVPDLYHRLPQYPRPSQPEALI